VVAVLVKKGKPFHCGYDVALLVLSNEASELLARNPIAKLRRSDPKTGESLVAVGFGVTSSGEPASTRQQRPVRVVATQPTRLRDPKPDGTSDDAGVGLGEFATTEGPCRGDSGGPALDASGAVVGVVSRVTRCGPGSHAVYGGVRAHATFLDAALRYAACVARDGVDACTAPTD
jgi:S1-C subfamily serine protease